MPGLPHLHIEMGDGPKRAMFPSNYPEIVM